MASGRIKGITIDINGNTTPLTNALKSVNKTISKTQGELRDVNRLLKLDPKNVELLKQKQTLLSTAMEATNKKLEEEKRALEQLKNSGNTEKTQEQQRALEREIIATKQSMDKLEKESKETGDALKNSGKKAKEAGDDAKKGEKGFSALKVAMGNLASEATKAAAKALVSVGKAAVKTVGEAAKAGDEIDKMSQKLGLSRKGYQEWDFVLSQAGVDINSMQTGMKTMTNKIDAAKKGTDTAVAAFDKLGISVKDLEGMSREDAFKAIVTSMQGMKDSTERAALANQLFGKSGQNLTPLFNTSAEATQQMIDKANELGMVMGDDAVDAGVKFQDQLAGLQHTFDATKNGIVSSLLPGVTQAMSGLQKLMVGSEEGAKELQSGVTAVITNIGTIFEKSKTILEPILTSIISVLPSIFSSILNTITALLPQLISAVLSILPPLLSALAGALPQISKAILGAAPLLIRTIVDIATLLLPQIGKILPKIVNQIILFIPSLVDSLLAAIPILINAAYQFLMAIVKALPKLISSLSKALPKIINTLVNFLTNGKVINQMINASITLFFAIINAIPKIVISLAKAMPKIINAIISGVKKGVPLLLTAAGQAFETFITKAKETAVNLVTGLWQGISDKAQWLKDKIKGWVGDVMAFLKKLFGIKSPSKKTAEIGKFLVLGLNQGIQKNAKTTTKAVLNYVDGIKKALYSSNLSSAASAVGKTLTANVSKSLKKQEKAIKNSVDVFFTDKINANQKKQDKLSKISASKRTKAQNKELAQLKSQGKKLKKLYSSFGKNYEKLYGEIVIDKYNSYVKNLSDKINGLTAEMNSKISEIQAKADEMKNKLFDFGDRWTISEDWLGVSRAVISDLKPQIQTLKKYQQNLNNIKNKIPENLLAEITALDVKDAIAVTDSFLAMSDSQLNAWIADYKQKEALADSVSSSFYADKISKIKTEYTNKIKQEMSNTSADIEKLGKNAIEGFIKGMSSVKYTKDIKKLANNILNAFKKSFGIHSPSTVMRDEIGKQLGAGINIGLLDELKTTASNMNRLLTSNARSYDTTNVTNNNQKNVTVNQYNTYSVPHSRYELWLSEKNLRRTIGNTVRGAV